MSMCSPLVLHAGHLFIQSGTALASLALVSLLQLKLPLCRPAMLRAGPAGVLLAATLCLCYRLRLCDFLTLLIHCHEDCESLLHGRLPFNLHPPHEVHVILLVRVICLVVEPPALHGFSQLVDQ